MSDQIIWLTPKQAAYAIGCEPRYLTEHEHDLGRAEISDDPRRASQICPQRRSAACGAACSCHTCRCSAGESADIGNCKARTMTDDKRAG